MLLICSSHKLDVRTKAPGKNLRGTWTCKNTKDRFLILKPEQGLFSELKIDLLQGSTINFTSQIYKFVWHTLMYNVSFEIVR